MPSRPAVAAILAFWLGTTGLVFYRDAWPRLFGSGPPPIAIDLEDEARSSAGTATGIQWKLLRGDQTIGRVTTRMVHVDADDTFRFTSKYSAVQLDVGPVRVQVPELTTTTRVTRSGELREQTMEGNLVARFVGIEVKASATAEGRVEGGRLVGRCDIKSTLGNVTREFEPVPVPSGHAINPLQPVSRFADVRPGRRWVVQEVSPLEDAIVTLIAGVLAEHGVTVPERKREPLYAEVLPSPETTRWKDEDVSCWVIEYRRGDATARTWVRRSDGKVLRQEAFLMGERLAVERQE